MAAKIKDDIRFLRYYIPALWRVLARRKDCFLLVGTPLHGNIGDQAIVLGEEAYFERVYPGYKLIEVPSRAFIGHESAWRQIALRCRAVFLHGGGYLGTLWPDEDRMVRACLDTFFDLPIIVLPQTLYFEKGEEDPNVVEYREAVGKCADITICLRERESYELAVTVFGVDKTMLIPDMVLNLSADRLGANKGGRPRSGSDEHVLLCLRKDKERSLNARDENEICSAVKSVLPDARIIETDTVIGGKVAPSRRREVVRSKIKEFQRADLVVTDRLHGMVLAAISGAPTIALKSKSPKVEGVYALSLSEVEGVRFCTDLSRLSETIESVIGNRYEYDPAIIIGWYDGLTRVINALIGSDIKNDE